MNKTWFAAWAYTLPSEAGRTHGPGSYGAAAGNVVVVLHKYKSIIVCIVN